MSPGSRAALGVLLLVVGVASGAVAAAGVEGAAQQGPDPLTPTETDVVIELDPEGDATWTITAAVPIEGETDRQNFEEFAGEFRNGEAGDLGLSLARQGRATAADETGRAMTITDVSYEATVPAATNGTGTLSVRFTWTNFARTTDGRLVVGDAFNTSERWFPALERGMDLRMVPPDSYDLFESDEGRTVNGTYVWDGPHQFDPGEPNAVFAGDPSDDPGGALVPMWLAAGLLLVAVGAIAVFAATRRSGLPVPGRSPGDDDGEAPAAAEMETTDGSGAPVAAADEPAGDSTDEPAGNSAGDEAAQSMAPTIDEELLSDEERVERLLEQNGGRMKQATIVKETGWSNAKVSQLLSSMAEEDRVDKLRIGRENLISFPDEDVADIED